MRIKLGKNLFFRLIHIVAQLGHETDTVPQEDLAGEDDAHVWQAAQSADRFFITQGLDFSDVRRFLPGTHHGLLFLRLREPGRKALVRRIQSLFQTESVEACKHCFVLAIDHKIRVRAPRQQNDTKND